MQFPCPVSSWRSFLAVLLLIAFLAPPALPRASATRECLDAALAAERWIHSYAQRTSNGTLWPAHPSDPKSVSYNLYTGMPGIVLFYLEAWHATGDKSFLDSAHSGANALLAHIENEPDPGLYTGLAGIGFAITEAYKATKDPALRQGALRCVELFRQRAHKAGAGIAWSDYNDVIFGSAGIGLYLLYAAHTFNDKSAKVLAVQAGLRLLELGQPENGGLKWPQDPKFPRLMPNFSHGTAGVAYFLATLFQETHQKKFLVAALAGARYLLSIAKTDGGVCFIFFNEPWAKDIYYLGWCHGPAGTARLFYRLYQVTGDRKWMDWVKKGARGVLASGIPEKQTPGFWNNVGQCCGSAGVVEFFLSLYRLTHDPEYLAFARRVAANLVARATREGSGADAKLKWIQAEHRLAPELLVAQTGYMQGAAGIAMSLLHFDEFDRGLRPAITLPDSPF
jgi:lantibiotic modifying enzyme